MKFQLQDYFCRNWNEQNRRYIPSLQFEYVAVAQFPSMEAYKINTGADSEGTLLDSVQKNVKPCFPKYNFYINFIYSNNHKSTNYSDKCSRFRALQILRPCTRSWTGLGSAPGSDPVCALDPPLVARPCTRSWIRPWTRPWIRPWTRLWYTFLIGRWSICDAPDPC
jgi:hypothetical protein